MRKLRTQSLLRHTAFVYLSMMVLSAIQTEAAERFGDVVVMTPTAQPLPLWHGYLDHRIRIVNESTRITHKVKLVAPHRAYSHGECISRAERTVVIGPESSATVSLFQPPLPMRGDGQLSVHVDGRFNGEVHLPSMNQAFEPHRGARVCILVSRKLSMDNLDRKLHVKLKSRDDAGGTRRSHRTAQNMPYFLARSDYEISAWSDNWLSYSGFDGVVLSEDDMTDASGPVREAVRRYVECGGALIIAGAKRAPDGWRASQVGTVEDMKEYAVGFGRIVLYPAADFRQLASSELDVLWKIWCATQNPWRGLEDGSNANKEFPVIGSLLIPVRGMFYFLLVFSILIGPVNLIVLARIKRRIWTLWTIPCVSAITCVAIFSYFLLAEGVTPTTRVESLTLLNEQSRHAVTLARVAIYCPLTPAGGLHFGHETEVTPLVMRRGWGKGSFRWMDWTRDQHLGGGWVTARIPVHLRVRKNEIRRERLQVSFKDETRPSVVNGFGERIERAVVADSSGRLYECRNVVAGSRATLVPLALPRLSANRPDFLRGVYGGSHRWTQTLSSITNEPSAYMTPGTYVVALEGTPVMKSGLRGKAVMEARSVVLGILPGTGE